MFVGFPRTGSTLLGALLNAHPDILIANEANALRFIESGTPRWLMLSLLVEYDNAFVRSGYAGFGGYTYHVPGQHQGDRRPVRVIGDKRGLFLPKSLPHLETLRGMFPKVRLLRTVRNPFDAITTHFQKKGKHSLEKYVGRFFRCEDAIASIPLDDAVRMRTFSHEGFLADPEARLGEAVEFLGLEVSGTYLADCAGIVRRTPSVTRSRVEWPPSLVAEVEARCREYPDLAGYGFAD
jgi:hypothetical protein